MILASGPDAGLASSGASMKLLMNICNLVVCQRIILSVLRYYIERTWRNGCRTIRRRCLPGVGNSGQECRDEDFRMFGFIYKLHSMVLFIVDTHLR